MQSLAHKVAFVTGASKGIGAGIAKELARAGATVIVNDVSDHAGAERLLAAIVAKGGSGLAIQGDFSKDEDIVRVYVAIAERHATIDILVNNAGVYGFFGIDELTPAAFPRQFNLNVPGLLLSVKSALPLFGPQGGVILNIGSIAGKMGAAMASVYAGTKGDVSRRFSLHLLKVVSCLVHWTAEATGRHLTQLPAPTRAGI